MRHPETGGVGLVPESAVEHQRGRGWLRVSDALDDDARLAFDPAEFADAPDLDAAPDPETEPAPKAPAKRSTAKDKE